jgi:phosphopantetheine adenylyltransferase
MARQNDHLIVSNGKMGRQEEQDFQFELSLLSASRCEIAFMMNETRAQCGLPDAKLIPVQDLAMDGIKISSYRSHVRG